MRMDREIILGFSIPEFKNWSHPFIFSSGFGRLNMYPGNIFNINCSPRSINISIFMSLLEKSWNHQSTAGFWRPRCTGSPEPISARLNGGYITSSLMCSSFEGWCYVSKILSIRVLGTFNRGWTLTTRNLTLSKRACDVHVISWKNKSNTFWRANTTELPAFKISSLGIRFHLEVWETAISAA